MGVEAEDLDAQIQRFASAALERDGVVTGWVLCVTTAKYDDDGETVWSWDYSVGPQTDVIRALGLVEAARLQMRSDLLRAGAETED